MEITKEIKPNFFTALLGVLTLGEYNKKIIEQNNKVYEEKYTNKLKNITFIIKSN
jgi:hypothetical protein